MEGDWYWYWGPELSWIQIAQQAANNAAATTLPSLTTASSLSGVLPAQLQAQIESAVTTPAAAFNPESWLSERKDAAGRISSADWTTGLRGLTGDERETLREYMFPDAITSSDLVGYNPDEPMVGGDVYKALLDLSMGYTVPNLGESGLGPDFLPGMNYASPLYPQSEMDTVLKAYDLYMANNSTGIADRVMQGLAKAMGTVVGGIAGGPAVAAGMSALQSVMGDVASGYKSVGSSLLNAVIPAVLSYVGGELISGLGGGGGDYGLSEAMSPEEYFSGVVSPSGEIVEGGINASLPSVYDTSIYTPEQRGLLPAAEAGGDVDQGWSTTGVPEAEQGPYVGPGEGEVGGEWSVNWRDLIKLIKGLQILLSIYESGQEADTVLPEQFYSWFGGGGAAVDDGTTYGSKDTGKTKLSNLDVSKLGGLDFPFDPRLLQYMNQYNTNYVGG